MKDEVLAMVRGLPDPAAKLNLLREFLQALSLRSLHESEALASVAFVGGTALRFLFNLPRFSEDLDFSLVSDTGYRPEAWMRKLKGDLCLAGFDAGVGWNDRSVVHKAWIKVGGVLKECGLAAMADQKLSIKLEIDCRPPVGAICQRSVVNRHRLIAIQHYDKAALMAGKLHALLTRGYPKGRDWYDLLWYRGQVPAIVPNLVQLQNALDQTQGKGAQDAHNWMADLRGKLTTLDCRALAADVQPFLERSQEADLLTAENVAAVLRDLQ